MGHVHTHDHGHGNNYYLDQLCTIASCGALGGVSAMMFFDGRLRFMLVPFFFMPVLVGGVALIVMAAIRAVTLWREADTTTANAHHHDDHDHDHVHHDVHDHNHDHDHGHDHDHEHEHTHPHDHEHVHGSDCGHADDCGHDHSWTPARYAVLMLPVVLYFLNLPNGTFSAGAYASMMASTGVGGEGSQVANKEGFVNGFKEIIDATYDAKAREAMEGKTGSLKGKYGPISNKQFNLYRVKMSCCAADAVPIPIIVVSEENITHVRPADWVEVEGKITFQNVRGKYVAVLYLKSADQVKSIPPLPPYGLD